MDEFRGSVCYPGEFVSVGGKEHFIEIGETVQPDGLEDALVQK